MQILIITHLTFSIFFILITLTPFLRLDYWWVRMFDFPRLQIATLQLGLLSTCFLFFDLQLIWHIIIYAALILCFIYQVLKIFRYTPLSRPEVLLHKGKKDNNSITLMVSNVLASNKNSAALIALVHKEKPDILLTLETNQWWEDELKVLHHDFPYRKGIPLDNLYGMHLFSRLELENTTIQFLITDEVPSIYSKVKLFSGHWIHIYCLHPKPPSPSESSKSTNRDAELLLVAKMVEQRDESVLVFGDLNDVAWSATTRLFQKVSGLLDPRVGRGFYNTFNAFYFLLRWPLDHIFHSNDFTLIDIKRLPKIGSDHFPIIATLHFDPQAEKIQKEHEANGSEKQLADKKIAKAN